MVQPLPDVAIPDNTADETLRVPYCRGGIVTPAGQLEDKVRLVGTGVHELLVDEPARLCTCAPEPKHQRYWPKTLSTLTMESLTVNAFEEAQ